MQQRFAVRFALPGGADLRVDVDADEYLLAAARRAGLALPAVCEQGWCIACAARLVAGEVDQSDALRVYAADHSAGFVLLCTAKPRSDLVIETHQSRALRRQRAAAGLPCPMGS